VAFFSNQATVFPILKQPFSQRRGFQARRGGEVLAGQKDTGETIFKSGPRSVEVCQGRWRDPHLSGEVHMN